MSPAIEHCVMSWEMLREWIGKSIEDMTEEELLYQPADKRNHAWWLYGHIVLSTDLAHYMIDTPALIPGEWARLFGMGTSPSQTGESYPSKEELIAQFNRNVDAAVDSFRQLTDDHLNDSPAADLPGELRDYFGTKGKIITGYAYHCMYHHGQIETIRKMLGK